MVITVDTSALLATLLNEDHKTAIIRLTKGHELQSPMSLDAEIGNALSAMFKRGRINLEQGNEVIRQFGNIPIRRTKVRLKDSLKLAEKYNIYAYDAYMLDCALQFKSPLLSLDKKLLSVAKLVDIDVMEVSL